MKTKLTFIQTFKYPERMSYSLIEANEIEHERKNFVDRFNIELPWSARIWLMSLRGAENFHLYLWIAKDFGKNGNYINPVHVLLD